MRLSALLNALDFHSGLLLSRAGVTTVCPPAEPVYVAIRVLIWLSQAVTVVGRLMKPSELERVFAAAVSVPVNDP